MGICWGSSGSLVLPSLAQLNPTPTSVGWAEIALSTELSLTQLNPTPTQLVGLIGSRISLKPA